MSFSLRKAHRDDIANLNAMIPESVRALSRAFYSPAQIEGAIQEIFGVDTQLVADGTYYVAEAAGELAGYGGWSKRRTLYGVDQLKATEDDLLDPAVEPARIRAFFIDPRWARRGIGSGIIERCENDALDAGFSAMALVATLPGNSCISDLNTKP